MAQRLDKVEEDETCSPDPGYVCGSLPVMLLFALAAAHLDASTSTSGELSSKCRNAIGRPRSATLGPCHSPPSPP